MNKTFANKNSTSKNFASNIFFMNENGFMNEKGGLILFILLAMGALLILLPLSMSIFQPIDILVRIILLFVIFTTVRGYLGPGVISIIVSGILIYFLVFKWWWIGAIGWWGLTLMSLGFIGVIVWGSSKIIPSGR